MSNQHIQMPLFASASQHLNDDFDFSEVFADYFVNEFDDPMNAYTGGMANYNVHVPMTNEGGSDRNPMAQSTASNNVALPTGGIRTAFHTATVKPPSSPLGSQGQTKKVKTDSVDNQMIQNLSLASSRQAGMFGMVQQPGLQQQESQTNYNNITSSSLPPVTLPVGVGIRFGNVVPAATTSQFTQGQQDQSLINIPGLQFNQLTNTNAGAMWNMFNQDSTAGMSEQTIAERRERNREHAKRSRVRKKFILESLQEQVRQLQQENVSLCMLIQEHIPDSAMQIFDECCTKNPIFGTSEDDELNELMWGDQNYNESQDTSQTNTPKSKELVRSDFSLINCLSSGQKCFVLSDPKLPDNPIVYATPAFYEMTGYTAKEVLGRNCRFLQGPGTDKRAIDVLRKSIMAGADATVCLLNYKADGTPFWNQLFVASLRDSDNCIVNYVGVQSEIEPESAIPSSLEDKVNLVLPLQGKDDDDEMYE